MSFGAPLILLLLPIVLGLLALLMVLSEQRRRESLAGLGNAPLVARLTSGGSARLRHAQWALGLGAAALLLFALARPQWGEEVRTVQREGIQVVVALDVSTSMLADDLKPTRLARAKLEIADLMQRLDGDEVALVLFAGASFVQFPLTSDYNTARQFLQAAAPGAISQAGTNVEAAIATAMGAFDDESQAQKVLVILTDGEELAGQAVAQARAAAQAGVRIFTVGLGSPEGAPVPALDAFGNVVGQRMDAAGVPLVTRLDESTLQQIAEVGGGTYALATPSGEHLDQLVAALDQLQAGTLGEQMDVRRIERFQPFLALSLLLLGAATLLPGRRGAKAAAPAPTRAPRRRVIQPVRRETSAPMAPRPEQMTSAMAYAPPSGAAIEMPGATPVASPVATGRRRDPDSGAPATQAWG